MARRSHQALSAAVAGACLTLCACGAASAPAAASPASPSAKAALRKAGSATLTRRFCDDASSFMRDIPAPPAIKHTTAAQARANLREVLRSTVAGFTALEAAAPPRLSKSLQAIVAVYKSDEKVLRMSGSLAEISQSMVKGNASGAAAFQQVLTYISVSCK
jgi:hypothetical protein